MEKWGFGEKAGVEIYVLFFLSRRGAWHPSADVRPVPLQSTATQRTLASI